MPDAPLPMIPVSDLRIGHFVLLDLGWMDHPFPRSSFRIGTQRQIDTIRALGLTRVRIDPARSDPQADMPPPPPAGATPSGGAASATPTEPETPAQRRARALAQQRRALHECERRYHEGTERYQQVIGMVERDPTGASAHTRALVASMLADIEGQGESAIRLLRDAQGDRDAQHAMNVTVLSVLLGRALGLAGDALQALGMAAFLHDIGKVRLPDVVRYKDDAFTAAQWRAYQEHVAHGVALGRAMGLAPDDLDIIAQHHEAADGSGFPSGCRGDAMVRGAHVLALVNRYDSLCNPLNPARAHTPHEALSLLFATQRTRFEAATLNGFIRMVGVYPPGSIVQLSDGRYAVVQACNAARPLKPRVLVHDPRTPRSEALLLDLQAEPELSIQRSLRAEQLPRAALDYLEPRPRHCYFFERATPWDEGSATGPERVA
ncbi:3'3'-cGAMP-specific phosphodiesterase 2 [Tepidimonas thermarum]|uniref:3'3'-cGAMP-specific phosphodiesterase 2 n=1 Tax=Tepidimonas thermarum TaxID=335431 RepID=A0A554X840_9BURK|nr:HD-GYP domain-containing protein [Tepidimonas thermarum]TSE31999.1 3'3'-cGAMP-specific phosphodiesterase 2 [Tepidimonas thermarum]